MTMNKIKSCIFSILTGIALYSSAPSQDFYNGCGGPKTFQMDNYVNYVDRKANGTIIPKLFTKNLDSTLVNIVLTAPFSISNNGKVDNKGINLGYVVEEPSVSIIGALGMFKDDQGKYDVINPQAYFTYMNGHGTLDLESSIPYNLQNNKASESASITLGYGLDELLRVGGSLSLQKNKVPHYLAIARLELVKDHRYWLEGYLGENYLRARLAINF
jgi:hypothetical protein